MSDQRAVFIIRFAERRIDQLLDACILDYAPQGSESETVQFESEWSFLRPFTKKKAPLPVGVGPPPNFKNPLASPEVTAQSLPRSFASSPMTPKFTSLKQTIARAHAATGLRPLAPAFADTASTPLPYDLTSFLTALQTLLVFADINPMFTTQLWSQVFYWTSCEFAAPLTSRHGLHLTFSIGEIFNRVITRKKYLCRYVDYQSSSPLYLLTCPLSSKAMQISANLNVVEDWVDEMGIPPGVLSHFAPVKDLLSWTQVSETNSLLKVAGRPTTVQCLSSITDFSELVAIIQSLKSINPLQVCSSDTLFASSIINCVHPLDATCCP